MPSRAGEREGGRGGGGGSDSIGKKIRKDGRGALEMEEGRRFNHGVLSGEKVPSRKEAKRRGMESD